MSRDGDIWVIDLTRGLATRLSVDGGNDLLPVWSPDSRELIFVRQGSGVVAGGVLVRKHASGVGAEQTLLQRGLLWPQEWSADGWYVTYFGAGSGNSLDLFTLPLTGDRQPLSYPATNFREMGNRLSPDGRFMVYSSDETGRDEIYVETFPRSQNRWRISSDGGTHPVWRRDGRELFFLQPDRSIMAVPVATSASFVPGRPHPLFRISTPFRGGPVPFAVSTDGRQFLVDSLIDPPDSTLVVAVDWAADTSLE